MLWADIMDRVDKYLVAEEMTEMLMDTNITTYDMFEDLLIAYRNGNEDFRKGMDKALETLVWKDMTDIVKYMEENCRK